MFSRLSLALFASASLLSFASTGCSTSNPTPNREVLSDLDGDGLYSSPGCSDGSPGAGTTPDDGATGEDDPTEPTDPPVGEEGECVIVPGPGGCTYAEIGEDGCVYCLDEAGEPTGDSVCDTVAIACELTEERDDGTQCWTCGEGDEAYTECYAPPVVCTTDADCGEGEHCELPPPFECPGEQQCPDIAPIAVCVADRPPLPEQ